MLALLQMYVEGLSTRKVAEITEALCGTSVSKSQMSALVGTLDADLAAWRERPLAEMACPYVFVDACCEHARQEWRVVSQGVIVVSAIRADVRREILAVEVANTESEAAYQDPFRRRKGRGLGGVQRVTSDEHAGLSAAVVRHFQGASWQRCQIHSSRNLLGRVGAATTREQATHLRVAELEDDLEDCLACLAIQLMHQPRIRSTNELERLHQELKRRTRVVRIFPNAAACLRLVTALCLEQSDEWVGGRRYLNMGELADGASAAPAAAGTAPPLRAVT